MTISNLEKRYLALKSNYDYLQCDHNKMLCKFSEADVKHKQLRSYTNKLEERNEILSATIKRLEDEYSAIQLSSSSNKSYTSSADTQQRHQRQFSSRTSGSFLDLNEEENSETAPNESTSISYQETSPIDLEVTGSWVVNEPIKDTANRSTTTHSVISERNTDSISNNTTTHLLAPRTLTASHITEYDFLYFYCQKGNSRNKIRRCLHVLGIDTSDVLDIIFPFHNIVGILVHKDDRTKICKILAKQANIKPIKNFNPMDPAYLGTNKDPHVSDEEQVAKLFKKHKKRCIHTLNFVPKAYFSPILVAFMSKGWLTAADVEGLIKQSSKFSRAASIFQDSS